MLLNTPKKNIAEHIVNHRVFSTIVISLILVNAILVGIETYPTIYNQYYFALHSLDKILLWLFTIEICLRLFAFKLKFFTNAWNWFDFIIVLSGHIFVGGQFVTVLRILRVLRVLRSISVIPSLRKLVDALLMTIPALGSILVLMSIIFYIFAVIGTIFFSKASPEYFGDLELSLLTLFQVVTLESWASGVMRPIFQQIPWSWTYFVVFILIGTFVVFNLFVGVIVSNVDRASQSDNIDEGKNNLEIQELRKEIAELKVMLQTYNQVAPSKDVKQEEKLLN